MTTAGHMKSQSIKVLKHRLVNWWQKLTEQGAAGTYLRDNTHTHTHLTALFPGLLGWAGTRKVKPISILLKQEKVSGSGISWAICKSAPHSRQITMPALHSSVFYRPDALPATQPTASKHWRQKHWRQKRQVVHNKVLHKSTLPSTLTLQWSRCPSTWQWRERSVDSDTALQSDRPCPCCHLTWVSWLSPSSGVPKPLCHRPPDNAAETSLLMRGSASAASSHLHHTCKQVCVQPSMVAANRDSDRIRCWMQSFAAECSTAKRRAAGCRCPLPSINISCNCPTANLQHAAAAVDRWDRQTDRQTLDPHTDPTLHTMWVVSKTLKKKF